MVKLIHKKKFLIQAAFNSIYLPYSHFRERKRRAGLSEPRDVNQNGFEQAPIERKAHDEDAESGLRSASRPLFSVSDTYRHRAIDEVLEAALYDDLDKVLAIISTDISICRAQDSMTGWTLLHIAAQRNNLCMVRALLKIDSSLPFIEDRCGNTALKNAAECGSRELLVAVLEANTLSCSRRDSIGRYPISYAIQAGGLENIKALLAADNEASVREDGLGNSPEYYSRGLDQREKYLINDLLNDVRGRTSQSRG